VAERRRSDRAEQPPLSADRGARAREGAIPSPASQLDLFPRRYTPLEVDALIDEFGAELERWPLRRRRRDSFPPVETLDLSAWIDTRASRDKGETQWPTT
jgi:hypothetical protein